MTSDNANAPRPSPPAYPARLDIEYPEEGLNRVTTAFRALLLIPIGILVALLNGTAAGWGVEDDAGATCPSCSCCSSVGSTPAGGSTGTSS